MNKADTAFILAASGLFASTRVNPGGVDGLFYGGGVAQFGKQLFGVVVVSGYTFVVSWILLKVIHGTLGMRLEDDAEVEGMDSTEHSETAYNN
jgi:Amt family ammonium transporter